MRVESGSQEVPEPMRECGTPSGLAGIDMPGIIMPGIPGITCANSRPAQRSGTAVRKTRPAKLLLGDLAADLAGWVRVGMDVGVGETGEEKLLERVAVHRSGYRGAGIQQHTPVTRS